MSLEQYTKAEIINAIKIKSSFDCQLVPTIERILREEKHKKAFTEWEIRQRANAKALEAFIACRNLMVVKYGADYLKKITDEERDKLLKLARKSDATDAAAKAAYKKLKEVQNECAGKI